MLYPLSSQLLGFVSSPGFIKLMRLLNLYAEEFNSPPVGLKCQDGSSQLVEGRVYTAMKI
jgi:hypothetical protein